jgi:adenylate cyclase
MKNALTVLIILLTAPVSGNVNRDSLFAVYNNENQPDSARLKAVHNLAWHGYLFSKPDSAYVFAQLHLQLAEKAGKKDHRAIALNTMGASFHVRGEYKKALEYYQLTYQADSLNDDPRGMAGSLNNIGSIYSALGNYEEALTQYEHSVSLLREAEDMQTLAFTLHNMGMLSHNKGDYGKALEYYAQSIEIKEQIDDKLGVATTLNNIGNTYNTRGDYVNALSNFRKALTYYDALNNLQSKATTLNNIGNIFRYQKDYPKATDYYQRSLVLCKEIGDQRGISLALHSLGTTFLEQKDFGQARNHFQQSLEIDEATDDLRNMAYSLHNIGSVYAEEGNHQKALQYIGRSLEIQQEIADKKGIVNSLTSIGKSEQKLGNYNSALKHCNEALAMAVEMDALSYQKDACECLYKAYREMGEPLQALIFYERKIALNDSLNEGETIRQLERMEFSNKMMADSLIREEEKLRLALVHERELSRQTQNRNIAIATGVLMLLLAGGTLNRLQYVRRSKAALQKEKDRSEELLLNILPEETAEELKEKGSSEAQLIESVTVLFTDFKGFTQLSEILTPKELVRDLHDCFSAFDRILDKYGIEKIKTIGDAYMAAGGLPTPTSDHAKRVVSAALEMRDFVEEGKQRKIAANLPYFEIRIGGHTGPVVAGIVGIKKFQYDIWGDTVNTASRMESSGEVGKVNISAATYELLKDDQDFAFESRGKIKAKGKGEIEMLFVKSRK